MQEEKNKYATPVAIPLGELARGSGQCTPGSAYVVAACSFGGDAAGNCTGGSAADGNCGGGDAPGSECSVGPVP